MGYEPQAFSHPFIFFMSKVGNVMNVERLVNRIAKDTARELGFMRAHILNVECPNTDLCDYCLFSDYPMVDASNDFSRMFSSFAKTTDLQYALKRVSYHPSYLEPPTAALRGVSAQVQMVIRYRDVVRVFEDPVFNWTIERLSTLNEFGVIPSMHPAVVESIERMFEKNE